MSVSRERPNAGPELPAELLRAVFSSPPLLSSDKDRRVPCGRTHVIRFGFWRSLSSTGWQIDASGNRAG